MKRTALGSLSYTLAALALAACGGGGSGTSGAAVPAAIAVAPVPTVVVPSSTAIASRAIARGSYWSGTISGVNDGSILANCGQSNFAQEYGCLPVTTSGAVVTGTPVVGQYFQMWGDLSKLPKITATTINYGPTPFPATAPVAVTTTVPVSSPPVPLATLPAGSPSSSVPSPVTTPVFAGVVSGVGLGSTPGFVANCGQSNFGGYGCIPVNTANAKLVGNMNVGAYFQLWGTVSPPNVTAMYVIFSPVPFSTATAAPPVASTPHVTTTARPSAPGVPIAPAPPTLMPMPPPVTNTAFANGRDYATTFRPFAASSVWNMRVSANPTIAANSAAIVAHQFPNGGASDIVRANEAGQYDYYHPRFFAASSDPLVRVVCNQYCGASDNGGVPTQIHIPAKARPAGGSDGHFDIVQPDGTDISMWTAQRPSGDWTNGSTVTAGNVANCGSFTTGQGWLPGGPGPTAAGYCDNAGVVTAAELLAGQINHAIFVTGECAVGNQYPVENGGSTQQCTSGVGPPLGGREWYDVPCATTQANSALRPWEKAILCALNQYGGYMGDNGSGGSYFTGGVGPEMESEEPWYDYYGPGYTSPFAALASQNWTSISIPSAYPGFTGTRWIGADPWRPAGVDFASHIHWLDACSARGTC